MQNRNVEIPESSGFHDLERQLAARSERNRMMEPNIELDEAHQEQPGSAASVPGPDSRYQSQAPGTNSLGSVDEFSQEVIKRDEAWANVVEPRIRLALSKIPNLSNARPVSVACFESRCEATASIYSNIPEFERSKSLDFIVQRKFEYGLGNANAKISDVKIDTDTDSFTVHFSRIRAGV